MAFPAIQTVEGLDLLLLPVFDPTFLTALKAVVLREVPPVIPTPETTETMVTQTAFSLVFSPEELSVICLAPEIPLIIGISPLILVVEQSLRLTSQSQPPDPLTHPKQLLLDLEEPKDDK